MAFSRGHADLARRAKDPDGTAAGDLSGMLPICASCKKIRDDKGYWNQLEAYISNHADVLFSHCLCPDCAEQAMKELDELKASAAKLTVDEAE